MITPAELLHSVVSLLMSDRRLGLRETRFVRELAQRLGLGPDAWAECVARVEKGLRKVILPRDPAEAQELMATLIDAAAVDARIADEERAMLRAVAGRVGISERDLDQLLESALEKVAPRLAPPPRDGALTAPAETPAPSGRKVALVKAALAVIKAEGGVNDAEQSWLDGMAARLGVDLWQLPPGNVSLDDLRAGSAEDRESAFRILAEAAQSDGVLGVMEKGKLSAFAAILAIDSGRAAEIVGQKFM